MTDELEAMMEAALSSLAPEDEMPRRSFVYGSGRGEGELVTWEMIVEADAAIRARMGVA